MVHEYDYYFVNNVYPKEDGWVFMLGENNVRRKKNG